MTTTEDSDIAMHGTIESLVAAAHSKLRADITMKLEGQKPQNWPRSFYEAPFLFFFADFFRRVCRVKDLQDREVVMDRLKPLFSEIEGALDMTARELSHHTQRLTSEEEAARKQAISTCRDKIQDIVLTQKAVKNGKADTYLARREAMKQKYYLAGIVGSPDAKKQGQLAPAEKKSTHAERTKLVAKLTNTRKQQPQQVQEQPLRQPQPDTTHWGSTEENRNHIDHSLNARMRLSTGGLSLQRTRKHRFPKQKPQPKRLTIDIVHIPQIGSPLQHVQSLTSP